MGSKVCVACTYRVLAGRTIRGLNRDAVCKYVSHTDCVDKARQILENRAVMILDVEGFNVWSEKYDEQRIKDLMAVSRDYEDVFKTLDLYGKNKVNLRLAVKADIKAHGLTFGKSRLGHSGISN